VSTGRTRTAGPFLDKATLVRAAADLADRDGWSRLTLTRVAESVDRHVSSLYTHVDGLDDLRREIALLALDELSEQVWRVALGRSGGDALGAIAAIYRDYFRSHPGRSAAINAFAGLGDPEYSARGARLAEPIRATLAGFGLDPEQVAVAHRIFTASIRGLALGESRSSTDHRDADAALAQTVDLFVTALDSGAWPRPH